MGRACVRHSSSDRAGPACAKHVRNQTSHSTLHFPGITAHSDFQAWRRRHIFMPGCAFRSRRGDAVQWQETPVASCRAPCRSAVAKARCAVPPRPLSRGEGVIPPLSRHARHACLCVSPLRACACGLCRRACAHCACSGSPCSALSALLVMRACGCGLCVRALAGGAGVQRTWCSLGLTIPCTSRPFGAQG